MGDGTRIRSSPGNTVSRPPLKKNVTCAYFSVSAMRSWVSPARDTTSPKVSFRFSGGNSVREKAVELRRILDEAERGAKRDPLCPREAGETGIEQRGGNLAHPVGAKIGDQQTVAVVHPDIAGDRGRQHELVGLAAGIGGFDRRSGSSARSPVPLTIAR